MARWRETASAKARLAVANTTSAFGFALRRLRVRTALRHHHVPCSGASAVVSIALIILAAAYFDPVFGAHIVDNSSLVTRFGRAITDYGKSGWSLVPLAVFLCLDSLRRLAALSAPCPARCCSTGRQPPGTLSIAIGGSGLIVTFLKQRSIGRARPMHFAEHGTFYFDSWAFARQLCAAFSLRARHHGGSRLLLRRRPLPAPAARWRSLSRSTSASAARWLAHITRATLSPACCSAAGSPISRQSASARPGWSSTCQRRACRTAGNPSILLGRRHRRRLSNWSIAADRRLHALARKPYRAPPN